MDQQFYPKGTIDKSYDRDFYMKAYKDVRSREIDPRVHYNTHGKSENRLGSANKFLLLYPLFDAETYSSNNLDLSGFSHEELMAHYHHHGQHESRICSKYDGQKIEHKNTSINPETKKLLHSETKTSLNIEGKTSVNIEGKTSINTEGKTKTQTSQSLNLIDLDSVKIKKNLAPNKKLFDEKYVDVVNINKIGSFELSNCIHFDDKLQKLLDLKSETKPIYLVMANWGYPPFGGGECWLIDTMRWMFDSGFECYYVYFTDHQSNKYFDKIDTRSFVFGHFIQFTQNQSVLIEFIKALKPVVISHQGADRMKFLRIANLLEIPFVTGFCFWQDIIKMEDKNGEIFNKNMINKELMPDENFSVVNRNASLLYAVGQFVNVIVRKVHNVNIEVINTISDQSHYKIVNNNQGQYVTIINICGLKGGLILKKIIKNTHINIPFILVDSQNTTDPLNQSLEKLIKERNLLEQGLKSKYIKGVSDIKPIYEETKILLIPSLVDETFCRVGYEGMMNDIPILSTNNGNLKYLLDGYADFLGSNALEWSQKINEIYHDNEYLEQMRKREKPIVVDDDKHKFISLIKKYIGNSITPIYLNSKSVGLFCPWADQGLGIQCREYYELFEKMGYDVSVFSFKPYHANGKNPKLQTDPSEWNHQNIYYSQHTREMIPTTELITYLHQYKVKTMIMVETCFNKIFEFAEICQSLGIRTIAIPNLETVRYSEMKKHNVFTKILCNNHMTYSIMNHYFPNKTELLGFRIMNKNFTNEKNWVKNHHSFFCVGGLNSLTRKNIIKILSAFRELEQEKRLKNYQLYVYIQGVEIPENIHQYKSNNIHIIIGSRSYAEIVQLYKEHDIFIHMGDHEGLGLGFYESIACNTPVLTIDTPPNNEIIKEKYNGWLIPCDYEKLSDNNEGITKKAKITTQSIKTKLSQIISTYHRSTSLELTSKDYVSRFHPKNYLDAWKRFLNN